MLKLLNNLKTLIENTYSVDSGLKDVSNCIISEKSYKKLEKKINFELKNKEFAARTLLYQMEDDLCLSLCFSDKFIADYEANNPRKKGITNNNFHLICTMAEELDHYILVSYSAKHEKPLTWFEAEMQAGITEYLIMNFLISKQQRTFPRIRPQIKTHIKFKLFDENLYDHLQDEEIRFRYKNASKMARAFVSNLESINEPYQRSMELKEFYRKSPRQKIEYIIQNTGVGI